MSAATNAQFDHLKSTNNSSTTATKNTANVT